MDSVKNPKPLRDFPVTTLLLVSFVGLFAIQVLTGVNAESPSSADLFKWGANTLAYSAYQEPWRLISAGFLHIGIMHLLFNGFSLYYFGQVAEKIFGGLRLLSLFLLAVIGGNLLNCYLAVENLLVNNQPAGLSAGASGGIMGIGAALLVCALLRVRVAGIQLNVSSLLLIMVVNLSYGFVVSGIDNAGHIGGAVTGTVLALVFSLVWRLKPVVNSLFFWSSVCMLIATFYWIWQYINGQLLAYLS